MELTEEQKEAIRFMAKITRSYDPNVTIDYLRSYLSSFSIPDALYVIEKGENWLIVWCHDQKQDKVYCAFSGRMKGTERTELYAATSRMFDYADNHASIFECYVNENFALKYTLSFTNSRNYEVQQTLWDEYCTPVFGRYFALVCRTRYPGSTNKPS